MVKEFENLPSNVSPEEVLKYMGYTPGSEPRRILRNIEDGIDELNKKAAPRVVFERLQINGEDEQPVFLNGRELLSSKLKKLLGPCSEVVVFVSTIGDGIDDTIESIKEKHPAKAYVFDAIASLAAEKAADAFQESLDEVIPPESSMTLRYSPGYCDWNINDQKLIFDLVNPERIKVSLNGGCLMRPSKSISGLIGIGPKDLVKKLPTDISPFKP